MKTVGEVLKTRNPLSPRIIYRNTRELGIRPHREPQHIGDIAKAKGWISEDGLYTTKKWKVLVEATRLKMKRKDEKYLKRVLATIQVGDRK